MIHTLDDCVILEIQDDEGETSRYEIAFDDERENDFSIEEDF